MVDDSNKADFPPNFPLFNKAALIGELRRGLVIAVAVFLGISAFWVTFKPADELYRVDVAYGVETCGDDLTEPCFVKITDFR